MENNFSSGQQRPADNPHAAETGNASNPSPQASDALPVNEQLLPKEAEKYLREAGNIEDEPDAQNQKEMDEKVRQENKPDA